MRLLPAALAITLVAPALAAAASGASLPGGTAADPPGAIASQTDELPTGPAPLAVAANPSEILVVFARKIPGRDALAVSGNAPRNARVTLTLLATLAPDLPIVLLQRADVQADVNGRYSAVVELAPDHLADSIVTLVATTDGTPPATAQLKIDQGL
ncbi:MAG TPA: hypothetical protein VNF68_06970 [Candidatus Baltobacteraceae bacterium]|nr:hypothetical protein [Candidatus Baltobacteraceae bacterium]